MSNDSTLIVIFSGAIIVLGILLYGNEVKIMEIKEKQETKQIEQIEQIKVIENSVYYSFQQEVNNELKFNPGYKIHSLTFSNNVHVCYLTKLVPLEKEKVQQL